jgi:hypothetical protein
LRNIEIQPLKKKPARLAASMRRKHANPPISKRIGACRQRRYNAVRTGLPYSPPASSETSSGTTGRESRRKKRSGLARYWEEVCKGRSDVLEAAKAGERAAQRQAKGPENFRESSRRFLRVRSVVQSDDQKKPKWICFPGTIGSSLQALLLLRAETCSEFQLGG